MKRVVAVSAGVLMMLVIPALCRAQSTASSGLPVSVSIYDRTRVDTWQWFAASPKSETYAYVESLLRIGIAKRIDQWDWQLELAQPAVLGLPMRSQQMQRRDSLDSEALTTHPTATIPTPR